MTTWKQKLARIFKPGLMPEEERKKGARQKNVDIMSLVYKYKIDPRN